jgi:HAD superfamily hydrolase (TIGR01549 family)
MTNLFLFDIDGTILKLKEYRSRKIFQDAFLDLFGVVVGEENTPYFSGMTDLNILKIMSENVGFDYERILREKDRVWNYLLKRFDDQSVRDNIVLMPKIQEFLDYLNELDNCRLALLTGNFRDNAYLKLKAFALDKYFPVGAFGCDKPDRNHLPEIAVNRAISHWREERFSIESSVVLGDSPLDIECAKSSGALSLAVATGFHSYSKLGEYEPDILCEDFNDYKNITDNILNIISERNK